MKHLITLAAVALFAAVTTTSAAAQQPAASKPAMAAPAKAKATKPAAKWTAAQIKDAQTGLQKGKYYTGKINGMWSARTVKAYKAWEKANGLTESAALTEDNLTKLKAVQ
jgi:peptidoglycan hydrolase-like protein with peptidoglycan-binding domain